jgi:hypothetical protein
MDDHRSYFFIVREDERVKRKKLVAGSGIKDRDINQQRVASKAHFAFWPSCIPP